jgi:pyruvate/2-oxoglutarate/acetoin dehydrogenase E1 component
MSKVDHIRHFLSTRLESNSQLFLLGEDLELRPETQGLIAKFPDQVRLLPASDSALMGVSIGLGLAGKTVVVQLASASGLPTILGMLPQFGAEFPTHVIVRVPVTPTDFVDLNSVLAHPELRVYTPHNAESVAQCLDNAMAEAKPALVLEDLLCRGQETPVDSDAAVYHTDIWAWGSGLEEAMTAAEALRSEGIMCRVQALTQIQPISDKIGSELYQTGRVVLVNLPTGLLSSIHKAAFWRLENQPVFCAAQHDAIKSAVQTVMTP